MRADETPDAEWHRKKERLEAQLDHLLATYGNTREVAERAQRARMKALLLSSLLWVAWFGADAAVLLQAPPQSPLQEWWPQISTVLVALVAIVTLRTSFTAHKEYVNAQLLMKADKGEVTAQLAAIKESLQALRESTRDGFKEMRDSSNAGLKESRDAVNELRKDVQRLTPRAG